MDHQVFQQVYHLRPIPANRQQIVCLGNAAALVNRIRHSVQAWRASQTSKYPICAPWLAAGWCRLQLSRLCEFFGCRCAMCLANRTCFEGATMYKLNHLLGCALLALGVSSALGWAATLTATGATDTDVDPVHSYRIGGLLKVSA